MADSFDQVNGRGHYGDAPSTPAPAAPTPPAEVPFWAKPPLLRFMEDSQHAKAQAVMGGYIQNSVAALSVELMKGALYSDVPRWPAEDLARYCCDAAAALVAECQRRDWIAEQPPFEDMIAQDGGTGAGFRR